MKTKVFNSNEILDEEYRKGVRLKKKIKKYFDEIILATGKK